MKKILAISLSAMLLLMPVPAYADDDLIINSIQFDSLEELILERNHTVQILENSIASLDYTLDSKEDSYLDAIKSPLEATIEAYEKQIEQTQNDIDMYSLLESAFTEDHPAEINPYTDKVTELTDRKTALETSKASTLTTLGNLNLKDKRKDFKNNISTPALNGMRINADMGKDMQVYLAENYYLGYKSLERQISELDKSYSNLKDQKKAMELRAELGLVDNFSVSQLRDQINELYNTLASLRNQLSSIKGDLNLSLNQDYDTKLDLSDLDFTVDSGTLNEINYDKDLDTALDASYSLKLAKNNYVTKSGALDNAEIIYGDNSDEYDSAELDFQSEYLKYEDAHKKFYKSFDQTYSTLQEKRNELGAATSKLGNTKVNFETTKLKYELGLISKLDYEKAQVDYETEQFKLEDAKQALFQAYSNYQWFLKGLDSISEGSADSSESNGIDQLTSKDSEL